MWIWILAGGGIAYMIFKQKAAEEPVEVLQEEVVFQEGYDIYQDVTALQSTEVSPPDPLVGLANLARKLLNVASLRMPFMPPMTTPKTVTRGVIDQIITDLSASCDACFGVGEWQEFIFGPTMSRAQLHGMSGQSEDEQRKTVLQAYILFFENDTEALGGFVKCMKAEHTTPTSTPATRVRVAFPDSRTRGSVL